MTTAELREFCNSLNDKNGTGGQTELSKRLGWSSRTMRRKLAGDSEITLADELAVRHVVECNKSI